MVNLNKPLRVGEGSGVSQARQAPHVTAKQITIVGIAQVEMLQPPRPVRSGRRRP